MPFSVSAVLVLQALGGASGSRPHPHMLTKASDGAAEVPYLDIVGAGGAEPSETSAVFAQHSGVAAEAPRFPVNATRRLSRKAAPSKQSLLQHSFGAASAATGMPVWAVRAAAWPVLMHPGVAASAAALDMAASCGNLTDAAASFLQLSRQESAETPQDASDDAGVIELATVMGLFLVWGAAFFIVFLLQFGLECVAACSHKARVTNRRPEFPEAAEGEVSMAEEPHDFHNNVIRWCGFSACLYALACPAVRHADTLAAAGVRSYWATFAAFIAIEIAFGAIFVVREQVIGWSSLSVNLDVALYRGLALAALFVPARRALRVKFQAPKPG